MSITIHDRTMSGGDGSVPSLPNPPGRSDNKPVKMTAVASLDGLSNTLMIGEKNHVDVVFDTMRSAGCIDGTKTGYCYPGEYPLYKWSAWCWMGGFKGVGHVTGSSTVPINYVCPESCRNSMSFTCCKDRRLNAFGSNHSGGGANFVLADGSVRFVRDTITQGTYDALVTRNGGDSINEDF